MDIPIKLIPQHVGLKERSPEIDRNAIVAVDLKLLLQILSDIGGPPAQLHNIDIARGGFTQVLNLADTVAFVQDQRETVVSGFGCSFGQIIKLEWHVRLV